MMRYACVCTVVLLTCGFARPASAEPAWGANCLSCHGGLVPETLFVFGEDTVADPDESATGAPDRGTLKVFEALRGTTKTLQVEIVWLDPDDTYAIELKRLRFPGVENDGELLFTGDCAWAYWGEPGQHFSDPAVRYRWGTGPTTFAFDIDVHADALFDYYDLVFALAGKSTDGGLFYAEEHFYLQVIPGDGPYVPEGDVRKNRYVSFVPNNDGATMAYQVEMTASAYFPTSTGVLGWVGEPFEAPEDPGVFVARVVDTEFYTDDWPAVVHLGDCPIVPVATYAVRGTVTGHTFTDPAVIETIAEPTPKKWADVVGAFSGGQWTAPNGVVNMDDVMAAVLKFKKTAGAPHISRVDIDDQVPNVILNMTDIFQIVQAFKSEPYPFADPALCP